MLFATSNIPMKNPHKVTATIAGTYAIDGLLIASTVKNSRNKAKTITFLTPNLLHKIPAKGIPITAPIPKDSKSCA